MPRLPMKGLLCGIGATAAAVVLGYVLAVVIFRRDACEIVWEGGDAFDLREEDRLSLDRYIRQELEWARLRGADQWIERQSEKYKGDEDKLRRLDTIALLIPYADAIADAKLRAVRLGNVRRLRSMISRPVTGSQSVVLSGSYPGFGPIAFRVDAVTDPEVFEVLSVVAALEAPRGGSMEFLGAR